MRVETIRELAERDERFLPSGLDPTEGTWRFAGSMDFIEQYLTLCSLLTELDDFRRLGREVCEDLAATGVRYAEAVFSPSNHAQRLGGDWDGPIEALLEGLADGERATGVIVRLTPDIVRDNGPEVGRRVLEVALRFAGRGVIGLNCAGSERIDIAPFAPMFREAKDAGLISVPHAGEWAGPQNVWATLEHLLPDRIGHGVRAIEDPRLVAHLADIQIPLEVAPVSNVATGVYPSLREHPFLALRDAGVILTLNSDDPPMFGGWLTEVFQQARETWELRDVALADLARTGVRSSFADATLQASIMAEIDEWLGRLRPRET